MKKFFVIAAMLFAGFTASAQINIGAGYMWDFWSLKDGSQKDGTYNMSGVYAGVSYNINIVEGLGIGPGAYFSWATGVMKDENGKTQTLTERVVVYWSKKFYDREYYQHKSFLEFIEKLRQNPAAFRITATQARSLKKYFRKEFVNKETGEIVNANELLGMLDEEKLE